MSNFDKEAERERLREKYERDEEKREVTERMSELLLKGATMTNAHCQDCGDPIFRYDGQEFCPTCQKPVQRSDGPAADGDGAESEDGEQIEVATPDDETRVQFGGEEAADDPAGEPESPASEGAGAQPDAVTEPAPAHAAAPQRQTQPQPQSTGDPEAELSRTVAHFSRLARTTDDAGQAKAVLAAAREGAEALAALRR